MLGSVECGWSDRLVVVGGLLALLAVAALMAGSILLWAHQSKRDDDGYYTSGVLQPRLTPTPSRPGDRDLGRARRGVRQRTLHR